MSRDHVIFVPSACAAGALAVAMMLPVGARESRAAAPATPGPAFGAALVAPPPLASSGNCLLDTNGDPNGVNGYENGVAQVFGARRTLLDDFVVPFGETWMLEELHHLHVWDTLPPGTGSGLEVALRADDDGAPGPAFATLDVTSYMEMATGRVFFDRDEAESWTTFDTVALAAGRYWFEATVVGPEPNYWLTAPVRHEECWVNYEDVEGLVPGSQQFGVAYDLSWCLSGDVVLDPAGACCLADGTCLDDVPGGACTDGLLGIFSLGRSCADVTCAPYGACCLLDGSCTSYTAESECRAADGDFRDGEHCSLVSCQVRGACCLDDGTCEEISQGACLAASGDYRGDGVLCAASQCPPAGACCLTDGTCVIILEVLCTGANGDYQGDGIGCGITECPIGACCRPDGTCQVQTEGSCDRDDGVWRGDGTDCADFNGNGIPDACEQIGSCRSDTNDDDVVDFADLLTLLLDWGPCEEGADGEPAAVGRRVLAGSGACTLYYNGDADGVNGYSNATGGISSSRRTLLDDFLVRTGETWVIEELHHLHLWNTLSPGVGTGMEISLWRDDNGRPGSREFDFVVTDYMEIGTGRMFFDREEAVSWTSFEPVTLGPGRYWFDATIVGPENNFWLTAPVQNEECWVNYRDLGGLQRGTDQFGLAADLAWCLSGQIIFDTTGACCLPEGVCVVVTAFQCAAANGDYQGDLVGCGITECPTGACCRPDGTCAAWTEGACARVGGIWRGAATDCADFNGNGIPDECEQIGTCRSDSNGDGVVDFVDLLTLLVDWGPCEE